jgi:putative ABC transport system permease protein
MSWWRQLTYGLRALVCGGRADRDADEEVRHYLEEATAEHVARGLTADAAARAARLELGGVLATREQLRSAGWEHVAGEMLADLRYGARRLKAQPGFAAVAITTLAIGIGAATAIFSAVNPILFEPLPYPDAGRIVTLWDHGIGGGRLEVTFGTARELMARTRSFEAIAVMRTWQPTLTGSAEPERLEGQRVGAGYFRALGVAPALGAAFTESDDRVNGPNVVVIADGLWRRRFGGDPAIVGRRVTLNDSPFTIAGVMPRGFENVLAPDAEVWAPLQYNAALPADGREWGHHLRLVARLRRGVDERAARRDVDLVAQTPVAEFRRPRWASMRQGLIVGTLQEDVTRAVKPALIAVLGAVLVLLAIACVNVTNLLLARAAQRRGEFAMRAALGAGRARLLRQLLAESVLLAALGGGAGVLVAQAGVGALAAISPPGLPRVNAIRVDGAVLAFAVGVTTLIGIAFGIVPAIDAWRDHQHSRVQQQSNRTTNGRRRLRQALVVGEVALALVLLSGAGLLFRSLRHLFEVAPGFNPSGVLTMQVQANGRRFASDRQALEQFFAASLDRVTQLAGVESAAFASQLPLTGDFETYGVQFESAPNDDPKGNSGALRFAVTPVYFRAMSIPLRRGRLLDDRDVAGAPPAAVINESLAARRFGNSDPVGQRLRIGDQRQPWFTIVGVVGDVKQTSLALAQTDAVYTTPQQWGFADNPRWLVVRAHADPAALAETAKAAVWSIDKDQPIVRTATMDERIARSAAERRFALLLFEAFAASALMLAAVGLFGVLSTSVAERTREIGVRAALGASRSDIVSLVVGQALALTAAGVAVGIGGAIAASRALDTLLFDVSRADPGTYASVVMLLMAVSAAACWMPAWRAARIDPAITLRSD